MLTQYTLADSLKDLVTSEVINGRVLSDYNINVFEIIAHKIPASRKNFQPGFTIKMSDGTEFHVSVQRTK